MNWNILLDFQLFCYRKHGSFNQTSTYLYSLSYTVLLCLQQENHKLQFQFMVVSKKYDHLSSSLSSLTVRPAVTCGHRASASEWWPRCLKSQNTLVCARWHIHSSTCFISSLNAINSWTWREAGGRWKAAGRSPSPRPRAASRLLTPEFHAKRNKKG